MEYLDSKDEKTEWTKGTVIRMEEIYLALVHKTNNTQDTTNLLLTEYIIAAVVWMNIFSLSQVKAHEK